MARNNGFTLIEVVVIITLGALVAAMIVPFVGTSMTRSSEPVNLVTEGFEVNQVVENILAGYRNKVAGNTLNLDTFKTDLSGFQANGVTVTGKFIKFPVAGNAYQDYNGDGVFDPQDIQVSDRKDLLLVTAVKNEQTLSILLGGQ